MVLGEGGSGVWEGVLYARLVKRELLGELPVAGGEAKGGTDAPETWERWDIDDEDERRLRGDKAALHKWW